MEAVMTDKDSRYAGCHYCQIWLGQINLGFKLRISAYSHFRIQPNTKLFRIYLCNARPLCYRAISILFVYNVTFRLLRIAFGITTICLPVPKELYK